MKVVFDVTENQLRDLVKGKIKDFIFNILSWSKSQIPADHKVTSVTEVINPQTRKISFIITLNKHKPINQKGVDNA